MQLRDYQVAAVKSVYDYYSAGSEGNPLLVLPTASGKSVISAELMRSAFKVDSNQRMMLVTDVKELVEQNYQKLRALWHNAPAGIFSAGAGRRDTRNPIIFAGIQSVYNKAHLFGHRDLIIIDECHRISMKSEGRYGEFVSRMKEINPYVKFIGMTATPFRTKGGHLLNGNLFNDICFEISIRQLIANKYLCPVYTQAPDSMQVSMEGVQTIGREFNQRQMQQKYMDGDITAKAIADVLKRGENQGRKSFLFFCAGVEHAQYTHEILQSLGLKGATVCDKTPMDERERAINHLREGRFSYLTNNAVLTTGTDIPRIDCVVFLRSTKSRGLYVQCVGRGMRLHEEKEYCLLLDYGGNVDRFGPIDMQPEGVKNINASQHESKTPFRKCTKDHVDRTKWEQPPCGGISHAKATHCNVCGAPFVGKEKHGVIASSGEVITPEIKPFDLEIKKVTFNHHIKRDSGNETMRIDYYTPLTTKVSEWFSLRRAHYFLEPWLGYKPNCTSITELIALCESNARTPKMITCKENGKYLQVVRHDFT